MRRLAAAALAVLLGAAASCRGRQDGPPPVIVISIDTLRSDRLPAYGYVSNRTPHLDRFREDSVLFARAYAHSPLTLPSHASLFTGLVPGGHGVRDNIGFTLAASVPTLAETLKRAGYATGAAVSAYVLRPETGISRGFDFYEASMLPPGPDQAIGYIQRPGAATIAAAGQWLRQHSTSPFFFFLHLYEPHTPYEPPPQHRLADRYDGEVAYADELVGGFLDSLRRDGTYDRSLIILLSDHGEGLSDHGEEEHGIFLYRESLQVPLIVKLPRSRHRGRLVDAPVGIADVMPTILDVLNVKGGRSDGRSLLPALEGRSLDSRPIFAETFLPRFHYGWSELYSLIHGEHHYIHAPEPELFDLRLDPAETVNLRSSARREYAAIRRETEDRIGELPAPAAIDPEDAAKLAALGYLGGGASAPGSELPDPKKKITTFPLMKEAFTLYREKEYEKLAPVARELRRVNPQMPDAWFMGIRAAAKLGRPQEAVALLREGMREIPGNAKLAIEGANLFLDLGRPDEALQHAELAVDADPAQAWEIIARASLARRDHARAAQAIAKAEQARRDRPLTLLTRGRIAHEQGKFADALASYDRAAELVWVRQLAPLPRLHLYRGDALYRLGRVSQAEEAFRQEIRLFPKSVQPYVNLTLLYLSSRRTDEATRTIYQLTEQNPTPEGYRAVIQVMDAAGDAPGRRYWTAQARQRFAEFN